MSIGINVINELKIVLENNKKNNLFLLDMQNLADYCSQIYLEVKEQTNGDYAMEWCDDATLAIIAIANHFFNDGWTNTNLEEFDNKLNKLYKSKDFINWCLEDNDEDVLAIHTSNDEYNIDISNCFYVQILNDYGFYLQKAANAGQSFMLARLDKVYARKSLKAALKLIKSTLDIFK